MLSAIFQQYSVENGAENLIFFFFLTGFGNKK